MPGDTLRSCSEQGHAHWQPLPEASVSWEPGMSSDHLTNHVPTKDK